MLDTIVIEGRTITADALLTQCELARYLVEERNVNYHFTVKANQPTLLGDLSFYFQNTPKAADFTHTGNGEHERIETRKIWVTSALNDILTSPMCVRLLGSRENSSVKRRGRSVEMSYDITSLPASHATPEQILRDNRGHWSIESCHYNIDWNYDEDRSQIRSGFGPENITRLRQFAIGLLQKQEAK